MRPLKAMLVIGIMVFLTWVSVSTVNAGTYIGDYCWRYEVTHNGDTDTGIIRVAVTDMGNGHYFLNGKVTEEGEPTIQATHGNAEIANDKVYLTLNTAGADHEEMCADTTYIVLDWPSLNGTFEVIGICYKYDSQKIEGEHVGPGTVTFITCP